MKTLVIHPTDQSTDFLSKIYEGKEWKVVRNNLPNSILGRNIREHDRIVMLGHGSKDGLFGHNKILIGSEHVNFLRGKEIVAIWCNADEFVKKYGLLGFYTGMFISEIEEAYYEGVYGVEYGEIESSNNRFSEAVGKHIFKNDMLENVKNDYQDHDSAVTVFNHERLYFRKHL